MKWRYRVQVIFLAMLVPLAAGGEPTTNFSQYPGFARYFADNPPVATRPNLEQRALLMRYRPRFRLPEGQPGPVDFYRDYVAHGSLYDGQGSLVSGAVTPELLNRFKDDPGAEFRHLPPDSENSSPVIYARIDHARVIESSGAEDDGERYVFLTYHAVFRHSGLPKGLQSWKAVLLALSGDLRDWHQLDHYTAATVVLDPRERPVAVMLQQHNYLRTFLIGEGIDLPPDDRVVIDVAIRSNELYPHIPGRRLRRAVRFADRGGMAYLMGFGGRPFVAADDLTESVREANYVLEYLSPDDAFYMFQGFLGARRLLPGRSGPPGASYNTLPEGKPLGVQLLSGYWREGNPGDWERYRSAAGEGDRGFAAAQAPVFFHNLECLSTRRDGCRLR
jgi:hypothetical protein